MTFAVNQIVTASTEPVHISSVMLKHLEQSSQLDSWLDFDPYEDALWHDINTHTLEEDDTGFIKISLKLKQKGALSIREYSTDVSTNGDTLPDYNHISLHQQHG